MAHIDKLYNDLLWKILSDGFVKQDPSREYQGKPMTTRAIPSYHFEYSNRHGLPILTTKRIYTKAVIAELLFFMKGRTDLKYLKENKTNIWDKDAYNLYRKNGGQNSFDDFLGYELDNANLGPVYGYQWRNFNGQGIDQFSDMLYNMIKSPYSNRHIVMAWNPAQISQMALPPCHYGFLISVYDLGGGKKGFYLNWKQRSVDTFLGLPFNILSYSILGELLGLWTGYDFLGLNGHLDNVHIYDPHWDSIQEQLRRDTEKYKAPKLEIDENYRAKYATLTSKQMFIEAVEAIEPEMIRILGYECFPSIKDVMFEPKV